MAKGLGIAALVVSILAIFVPIVTVYVIWLALILAAVSGFMGDKAFPIASLLVCLLNLVFWSPATWIAFHGEHIQGGSFFRITTIILFIAPIAGLIAGIVKMKKVPQTTSN